MRIIIINQYSKLCRWEKQNNELKDTKNFADLLTVLLHIVVCAAVSIKLSV